MIRALWLLSIFLLIAQPSLAIREGTATAEVFIKRYTQTCDFGRLALWHEAAAECLRHISVPMNEIAHDYYKRRGYEKWAARGKKEVLEIQEHYRDHRTRAKAAWRKAKTAEPHLNAEREKIAKFMAIWLPRYPNQFYEFGIYPTFFRKQQELAAQQGNYAKALHLEADAAEMCAAQYEHIPVAYGLKHYEKFRDAYLRHATHLRELARQNPQALPPEVDNRKQIQDLLEIQRGPSQETVRTILHIAKSDTQVEKTFADQNGVHAHPSFQGFAWIVRFSNHSRGNLLTVIIDEKTMEVLDVF